MEWLTEHKDSIITIVASIMGIATVVASMTSTDADNKWIARIHRIATAFGLDLSGPKNGIGKK